MHHRIRPWHAAPSLLLLSLSTVAVAQAEPTLAQLTELVTEAHRTAAATTIVSFRADLRIEELARTAEEHRGQVELEVRFLDWKHPDTGRSYPLIRYRQTDSSRSIEHGRDREDYWAMADGKPQNMRSRELATDLEHARRNIKLARQMVQLVDPSHLLATVQEPSLVHDEELVQGRTLKTPCYTVTGKLPSFPLRQQDGEEAAVEAKLFVDKVSHRLIGLEVRPLPKDGETASRDGEFVLLSEHRENQGRIVPTRIVHFAIDANGKRRAQMGVDLTTLDLDAKLEPAAFDRPE
jgi:hypothetical protein